MILAVQGWLDLDEASLRSLIFCSVLLAICIPWLINTYGGKSWQGLRHISIWFGIGVTLVAAYAFKPELTAVKDRIAGVLLPGHAIVVNNGTIVINKSSEEAHFSVDVSINNENIRFILDTGASDVVLTRQTADRLGIAVLDQDYSRNVLTANGQTRVAPIQLKELRVASIILNDVAASVARPGELDVNLLGMSFLSRLKGYSVEGDRLTLRE
jgi:aspartyl protease family protein